MSRAPIVIADENVAAGENKTIDLVAGMLYTHEPLYMPVHVFHGKKDGPVLFVSAAIHGDELNGIEIIRRITTGSHLQKLGSLRGTLILVPIVNVFGVVHQSRYLPDRRDLNRSFPGSSKGSLAARMAHLFMNEVVAKSTHGIDLHTGAIHRANLPQVRGRMANKTVRRMAETFGAPVILDAAIRDGSLRDAATERGIPVLLFEGGEALRFDETAIRVGVRGVRNVMRLLGMMPASQAAAPATFLARSSAWMRAPCSGIFRGHVELGETVSRGQRLGVVADPFGNDEAPVLTNVGGVIIGRGKLPLVHEGDALYHIGMRTSKSVRSNSRHGAEQVD